MLKIYKPITPSLRHTCLLDKKRVSSFQAIKYLICGNNKKAGRNHHGHITVRHKGSGVKGRFRLIHYTPLVYNNIPGTVIQLEIDPNRSSFIALIQYKNGFFHYMISPLNMKIGDEIIHFINLPELLNHGSSSFVKNMPAGSLLYNIETRPTFGSKLVRSAGCSSILLKKENNYSIIKLPSGTVKYISNYCNCYLGTVSNKEVKFINLGKAGRSRWMGVRPSVRGIAMNPVDHPHGGGEGRKSGKVCAMSPWGKLTKGQKTSNSKNKKYV